MTTTTAQTDLQLQRKVLAALAFEPKVNAADIGVSVHDGIVTLTGRVNSWTQRYDAEHATLRVRGVRGVADEIEVEVPAEHVRGDEDLARSAANVLEANILVPEEGVHVSVRDGLLTLSGEVDLHFQREAAEASVRTLAGVRGVANLLTVRPLEQPGWGQVKQEIALAFTRHATLDANRVQVEVEGGVVTLRGTLRSWAERQDAENAAWAMPGVHQVHNELSISPS
ncbi:BON domain-containing protein [Deinococcus planocerae]|uniref:BON domain-containing protein n=1 Tax=Deinococcus planocerae TaxID=1737569 RepID=UPI000C7F37D0|nr:BON domain-containing protein [Deinococcus planocerae]